MANGLRRSLIPVAQRRARSPVMRGLRSSYQGIKAGLGGAEDLLGTAIGSKTLQQAGQQTFQTNAEAAARDAPMVNSLTQIHNVDSFINYSLGKVGELVPFAASLAVGGAVGRAIGGEAGQFAGITGTSGSILGGQNFEAAKAAGATPAQAVVPAAVSGLAQGSLDAILGAEFAKNLQGRVANVPGQAAMGAGINAAQTGISDVATSVAAPNTPLFTKKNAQDVLDAAAGGAIGGGLIGGVTRAIGGLRRAPTEPTSSPARAELIRQVNEAPVAASKADLSAEDLAGLTKVDLAGHTYINKTYTTLATSEKLAGKKFEGNSLSRTLEKLNSKNDGYSYELIPLGQMVRERARETLQTPAERNTYIKTHAFHKYEEAVAKNPGYARLFDPAKPELFLNHFEVIRKTPISPVLRTGSSLDLTSEDLANTMRTPINSQDIRRGEFTVLENGKPKRVNAMDLTLAGMKRTPATGATVTPARAGEAFYTGLTSLLEKNPRSGKADITLAGDIPPSTIVFTSKLGKTTITYGELKGEKVAAPNDALITQAVRGSRKAGLELHNARKSTLAKEGLTRPETPMGREGEVRQAPLPSTAPSEAEKQLALNQDLESQARGVMATESNAEAARIYKQATGNHPPQVKMTSERLIGLRRLAEKLSNLKEVKLFDELQAEYKKLYHEDGKSIGEMEKRVPHSAAEKKLQEDLRLRLRYKSGDLSAPFAKIRQLYKQLTGEDTTGKFNAQSFSQAVAHLIAETHKAPTTAREAMAKTILAERRPITRGRVEPPEHLVKLQALAEKLDKLKRVKSLDELRARYKALYNEEGKSLREMETRHPENAIEGKLRKDLRERLVYNAFKASDSKSAYTMYKNVVGLDPKGHTPQELLNSVEKRIAAMKNRVPEEKAQSFSEPLSKSSIAERDAQLRHLDTALQYTTKRGVAAKLYEQVTGVPAKDLTIAQMRQKVLSGVSTSGEDLRVLDETLLGTRADAIKAFKQVGGKNEEALSTPELRVAAMTKPTPDSFSRAEGADEGLGKLSFADFVKTSSKVDAELQGKIDSLSKQLGLFASIKLVTGEEAASFIPPSELKGMLEGKVLGVTHTDPNGALSIFLHPNLREKALNEVFAHEFGHAVMRAKILEMSDGEARSILADYKTWKGTVKTVGDVISSLKVGEVKKLLSNILGDRINEELGGARFSTYLTSFPEWFADTAAKWLLDQTSTPKTLTERFFAKLGQAMRLLTSKLRPGMAVQDYMDSLVARSGRWVLPTTALAALDRLGVKGDISNVSAAATESGSPYSPESEQLTKEFFDKKLTPAEKQAVGQAAMSLSVQRQFIGIWGKYPGKVETLRNDPVEASLAAYQLWRAGRLTIGPAARTIYGNVRQEMFDNLRHMTNDTKAVEVFTQIRSGLIALRSQSPGETAIGRIANHTRVSRMFEQATDAYSHIAPIFQGVFSSASDRLIKTNNPYLTKLANMIEVRVGTENQGEGMLAARGRRIAQFDNRIRAQFEGKTAEFGREVLEGLQDPSIRSKDIEVRRSMAGVRGVLGNVRRYVKAAGVDIGDKGSTYFPWVYDTEYMMSHSDQFKKLLLSFPKHVKNEAAADAIVQNILTGGGYADSPDISPDARLVPGMNAIHVRKLDFLSEKPTEHAKFFDKDLGHTLRVYGEQAVKRAEFVRRFGPKGEKFQALLANAQQFGATEKDLNLSRDFIHSVMGLGGVQTRERMYRVLNLLPEHIKSALDIHPPTPGEPINRKLQKAMGVMMVYQNVRILGLATLSSLSDPLGILLRSGDAGIAWDAFKGGLINTYKSAHGEKTMINSLGETLGVIDAHMTMEALGQEWGGVHLTGRARRVNEGFFKWMGLSGWTKMTRVMGLIGAEHFLLKHALHPDKLSERFLAQLNVRASDVHVNPEGGLKVLSPEQLSVATPAERDADTRVKIALNRFVDEAILRPTAAQRPIWASDPHFQLVFHMKSFTYAFTTRILARVLSEAEEGNLTPLMQASLFIPTMMAANLLRGFVETGGIPANQQNWGVMDYVAEAANRQNLYGLGSFGVDAAKDIQYGGLGVSSFLGPTLSQFAQIPGVLSGNLSDLQHAMPMSNVWRQW